MPKRDWLKPLILGLSLLAFTFAWASYHVGLKIGEARGERDYHAASYERYASDEIRNTCLTGQGGDIAECIAEVIKATNEDRRAEDDRVAQTEMARWAFYMLIATVVMAVTTGAGVIFVWLTLKATRQIGDTQSRAWLSVKCENEPHKVMAEHDGKERIFINIISHVKNHGHAPAVDVFFHATVKFRNDTSGTPSEMLANYCDSLRTGGGFASEAIFPAAENSFRHSVVISLDDVDEEVRGRDFKAVFPYVLTCTTYTCAHTGKIHQTRAAYALSIEEDGIAKCIGPYRDDWLNKPIWLTTPGFIAII